MIETVGPAVERLIKRHLAGARSVMWATVTSYDSQTHRARARLWPDDAQSGALPVLASSPGHAPPLRPGQQVLVLCADGVPAAIAGCVFQDSQPLPDAPFVNEGETHIVGDLYVYGQLSMRDEDRDGALDWMEPGSILPARANAAGGAAGGFATLDQNSHVVQQAVYDAAEASTMDTLGSTSTLVNSLNRLRNQLGVVIGGVGSAWNAAVQMIPLSQKSAASGVAGLSANSLPLLRNGGTPTVSANAGLGTAPSVTLQAGSTDAAGVINFTVGTGPVGGQQFTLTFSTTLAAAPKVVLNSLQGPNTGASLTASSVSATSVIFSDAPFTAGATFGMAYLIIP